MKSPQGMTLLELLVVIIILGIIASFAIGNYDALTEKQRVKDAQATLAQIYHAQQMYRLTNADYGDNYAQLLNTGCLSPDPRTDTTRWTYNEPFTSGPNPQTTFTATLTRVGSPWNGNTIQLDQAWTGEPLYGTPPKKFLGSHPYRD